MIGMMGQSDLDERVRRQKYTERVDTGFYQFPRKPLTEKQVVQYRRLGQYAMAYDRQSTAKELRKKEVTGQKRRVEAVLGYAELLGLRLGRPAARQNREEGQLAYHFETIRDLWFVDGLEQNSTGYSLDPAIRPELWRLVDTVEQLVGHDAAPKAVLLGELQRLSRDEDGFKRLCERLWGYGVQVFAYPFDEIVPQNLDSICQQVKYSSMWLPMVTKGARQVRKAEGRPYHRDPRFGLRFVETGDAREPVQVVTVPEQYNPVRAAIHRMATGLLTSSNQAIEWLNIEHGIKMSDEWLRDWLRSTIPEGIYVCHATRCQPLFRQDSSTGVVDRKLNSRGNQMYAVEPAEGLEFAIQYALGTEPIPPAELAAARAVIAQRGARHGRHRPKEEREAEPLSVLDGVRTRCVHSHSQVREKFPPPLKRRHYSYAQDQEILQSTGRPMHEQVARVEAVLRAEGQPVTETSPHQIGSRRHWLKKELSLTGDLARDLQRLKDWWADPFILREGLPHLRCRCLEKLASNERRTGPNVRHLLEHPNLRNGELGNPLFERIWEEILKNELPARRAPLPEAAIRKAEEERAAAQADLECFTAEIRGGVHGDPTDETDAEQIARTRAPIADRLRAAKNALEQLSRQGLLDRLRHDENETVKRELRALKEENLEVWNDPRMRNAFLRRFVRVVDVDLTTGEFVAHTRIDQGGLKEIAGAVGVSISEPDQTPTPTQSSYDPDG